MKVLFLIIFYTPFGTSTIINKMFGTFVNFKEVRQFSSPIIKKLNEEKRNKRSYKGAGIIPMSINEQGEPCVLVFQEYRWPSYQEIKEYKKYINNTKLSQKIKMSMIEEYKESTTLYWIDAAGKKENCDINSWKTAKREFLEETGTFYEKEISKNRIVNEIHNNHTGGVTYVIYFDYDIKKAQEFHQDKELIGAVWIPLETLYNILFLQSSLTVDDKKLYDCCSLNYHMRLQHTIDHLFRPHNK